MNKTIKISDDAAKLWGEVLRAVPKSRLLLLSVADNRGLLGKLARCGIDPGRVELAPPRPRSAYLELFNRIDIALDPFPYDGDTTTCDGLWMGVPLVTLAGDCFVSRRGVCYLNGVGLQDLIAQTSEMRAGLRDEMRSCALTEAAFQGMLGP